MASSDRSPRQSESKPNGDVEVKTPHRRRVVTLVLGSIAAVAIAVAVLVPLLCCKDPHKGGGKATNQLVDHDNSSNTDIVSLAITTATPSVNVTNTDQRVAMTTKAATADGGDASLFSVNVQTTASNERQFSAVSPPPVATRRTVGLLLFPSSVNTDQRVAMTTKGATATPDGRDASSSSVNIKTTASNERRFSAVSPLTVETRPTVGSLLFPSSIPLSMGSVWINTSEATSEMPSSIRSDLLRAHVAAGMSSSADRIAPSHPSLVPNPVISSSVSQTSSSSVRDCFEISEKGNYQSGVYTINPGGAGSFSVYCDMSTDGGGWTVFQRRKNQTATFNRNGTDYKNGFGSLWGEFWLGNDYIHRLTHQRQMKLRVDLQDRYNNSKYANYGTFAIGNGLGRYKLTVGSYSGSAGDALSAHNLNLFNAFTKVGECEKMYNGWWYSSKTWLLNVHCPKDNSSNLNGNIGIMWRSNSFSDNSMKRSEMKMRPTQLY